MISASITVYRPDEIEGEIEIEVEVSGQTEIFGSADWRESGLHIADWSVDSPKGFELTPMESISAEEALERQI